MITTTHVTPTTLGEFVNFPELILLVTRTLDFRQTHTRALRASSRLLRAGITTGTLKNKVRVARPVLLPSGAFRLHSRGGLHTIDVAVPALTRQVFPEGSDTQYGPVLLVRLNNVAYTARAWEGTHVVDGEAWWPPAQDWMNTGLANRLFLPETTILQDLAGGAWISRVDLDSAFYGTHHRCTIVHLTLHKSFVMVDGGEFKLQLVCDPTVV